MSRRTRERWQEAEKRWPTLQRMLAGYLHQDWDFTSGTVENALAEAISVCDLELKRTILREWRDWNATEGAGDDVRAFVDDGFGVQVHFATPIDARNFMNKVYDDLLTAVKAETVKDSWK